MLAYTPIRVDGGVIRANDNGKLSKLEFEGV